MKVGKPDNTTLDSIGKRVLAIDRLSEAEIDSIVSKPHLYKRVRARMAGNDRRVPFFFRYEGALTGMAAIAVCTFIAISFFKPQPDTAQVAAPAQIPAVQPGMVTRPDDLASPRTGTDPSPGRVIYRGAPRERVAAKTAEFASRKPERDVIRKTPEFYAISNVSDSVAGGHIVRVDMPRSALFAMGVDVPLENDSETVKADLLVGPDGLTRAVRVLK